MLSLFQRGTRVDRHLSAANGSDTPTDEQYRAIKAIDAWYIDRNAPQVFWLAGPAGTGKTRTTSFALQHLREKRGLRKYCVGTPTGKAAQVLRTKGVVEAETLHSLMYEPREDRETGEITFVRRVDGPFEDASLIVADEGSMIGDDVATDMIMSGKKILVIADDYQLPPVKGQGMFCKGTPDFRLIEPHRTALDSPVIRLANLLRQQQLPRRFGSVGDVHVLPLDPVTQRLVTRPHTQTICGVHRVRMTYTRRIRELHGYDGALPHAGERVICRRNQREEALFNGMIGNVAAKAKNARGKRSKGLLSMDVLMEGEEKIRKGLKVHPWMFESHYGGIDQQPRMSKSVHSFDYAYVITCHASQGSEFPSVTVVDDSAVFRDARWRWLYTAATRSQDELVLLLRNANLGGSWRMPDFDDCPLPLAA